MLTSFSITQKRRPVMSPLVSIFSGPSSHSRILRFLQPFLPLTPQIVSPWASVGLSCSLISASGTFSSDQSNVPLKRTPLPNEEDEGDLSPPSPKRAHLSTLEFTSEPEPILTLTLPSASADDSSPQPPPNRSSVEAMLAALAKLDEIGNFFRNMLAESQKRVP